MKKVYLDACCLNRLTDDQTQSRIRREAEAIEQILRRARAGEIRWTASEALVDEIERNPDIERRAESSALLSPAFETLEIDSAVVSRATELRVAGYGTYDALHLACAETAKVDTLLTTDDIFVRKAARKDGEPLVAVENPLFWSQENYT